MEKYHQGSYSLKEDIGLKRNARNVTTIMEICIKYSENTGERLAKPAMEREKGKLQR